MTGICRAGYTAFPISTRNSPAGVAHLLKQTGALYIFVSGEEPLQKLAKASLELIEETGVAQPTMCPMPSFEELYPRNDDPDFEFLPPMDVCWDDPIIILHSSGKASVADNSDRSAYAPAQAQLRFRNR